MQDVETEEPVGQRVGAVALKVRSVLQRFLHG